MLLIAPLISAQQMIKMLLQDINSYSSYYYSNLILNLEYIFQKKFQKKLLNFKDNKISLSSRFDNIFPRFSSFKSFYILLTLSINIKSLLSWNNVANHLNDIKEFNHKIDFLDNIPKFPSIFELGSAIYYTDSLFCEMNKMFNFNISLYNHTQNIENSENNVISDRDFNINEENEEELKVSYKVVEDELIYNSEMKNYMICKQNTFPSEDYMDVFQKIDDQKTKNCEILSNISEENDFLIIEEDQNQKIQLNQIKNFAKEKFFGSKERKSNIENSSINRKYNSIAKSQKFPLIEGFLIILTSFTLYIILQKNMIL